MQAETKNKGSHTAFGRDDTEAVSSSARQDRTDSLIRDRNRLRKQLAEVDQGNDPGQIVQAARLRRQLDMITQDLFALHRGLVLSYANQFRSHRSVQLSEDFIAAGMLGLMKAINSYDPDRPGAKSAFSSWAWQPIKREIIQAVRDADHPHLSRGEFEQRPAIIRAIKRLTVDGSLAVPTDEEVAAEAGCTVEQVRRVRDTAAPVSLQTPLGEDGDATELGDMMDDPDVSVEQEVITKMSLDALQRYGLRCLDPRELYVLVRRLGLDGEPSERLVSIGQSLGISREAARQIEAKALSKLNHPLVLQYLTPAGRQAPQ